MPTTRATSPATAIGERATSVISSAAIVVSMALFALGASIESIALIIAALSLSGVCLGVCSPAYMSAVTDAAEPHELGLASGMLSTSASLGTVVGIQLAVLALGDADRHEASDFVAPYVIGAAAALLMVAASTVLRPVARGTRPSSPQDLGRSRFALRAPSRSRV